MIFNTAGLFKKRVYSKGGLIQKGSLITTREAFSRGGAKSKVSTQRGFIHDHDRAFMISANKSQGPSVIIYN